MCYTMNLPVTQPRGHLTHLISSTTLVHMSFYKNRKITHTIFVVRRIEPASLAVQHILLEFGRCRLQSHKYALERIQQNAHWLSKSHASSSQSFFLGFSAGTLTVDACFVFVALASTMSLLVASKSINGGVTLNVFSSY